MKTPYLVSIAALMVATAARSEGVSATSVLGISYTNPSISLDDIVIPRVSDNEEIMNLPSSDLPDNDKNVDSISKVASGPANTDSSRMTVAETNRSTAGHLPRFIESTPIIYPRSLKIYENGGGPEPPRPEPTKYSLVAWSGSSFSRNRQLTSGMRCRLLTGETIASFQGEFRYKLFAEPYCYGRKTLESDGGKSSVRKTNPRSVYIY
ncbi:hypothetical protein BGX34_009337 [Mortierella sp. NVP85]|nr:hypothetical protein BGX34_009337 [Mortierella sp. NVP85]